jgi:hypothetical protein
LDNNCDGVIDEGCDDITLDGESTGTTAPKGGCSALGRSSGGWVWLLPLLAVVRRR